MDDGIARHFAQHEQHKHQDADRRHRLVFTMPVGMVFVSRPLRGRHADERDDVRRGIGERVKTVRENRDCAGKISERDLGDRNEQIEGENAAENADDRTVAIGGLQFKMQNSQCKMPTRSAYAKRGEGASTFTPGCKPHRVCTLHFEF